MKTDRAPIVFLVIYLLVLGLLALVFLVINFPEVTEDGKLVFWDEDKPSFKPIGDMSSVGSCLILMAFLAGVAGSFLHGAQSLSTYIGNGTFVNSWTTWYLLRPWVGGILGVAIYVAVRAGLVGPGEASVNPFGVVSIGLLGGWFSKVTTDKLQELFETLMKTEEDSRRKNKVDELPPEIGSYEPKPIKASVQKIKVTGKNFDKGATATIDGKEVKVDHVSQTEIGVKLKDIKRPAAGGTATLIVSNPSGGKSGGADLEFA